MTRFKRARRTDPRADEAAEAVGEGSAVLDLAVARAERGQPATRTASGVATLPDTAPAETDDTDDAPAGTVPDDTDPDETETASGSVLVDRPAGTEIEVPRWQSRTERRPVLPAWVRDRRELRDAARWAAGHAGHTAAYHAVRVPVYALRVLGRAPVGAARITGATLRWVADREDRPLATDAVHRKDYEAYLKLSRQHRDRQRWRTTLLVLIALALLAAGAALASAPGWVAVLGIAGVVGVLAAFGASADRPLIGPAVLVDRVQKLTSAHVIRALGALGLAEINKALGKGGDGITFPAPITRDGPGWRADIDLPHGVTVTDVRERRDKLASGLRRPLGCVWPEPAPEVHEGRLVLWVGDQDMARAKPTPWPLAKVGTVDLFQPIPFGTDPRGRPVSLSLMSESVLIGSKPRMGKTVAGRELSLAAALDPRVELRCFEHKGTGDLSPLEKVAHRYAMGATEPALQACVASLRELYADLDTRAATIASLPKDLCPDSKVTPELASRKSLRLHPVVMFVDECQEVFEHDTLGPEAERLCKAIIKRGPALGIILILSTQRPDAKSLPTGVSANMGIRFCLRVMGQLENDMVLGTSKYRDGIRATTFTRHDKGIGYLVGGDDDDQIVRTYFIDGPTADAIAERARAARIAAGRLTGHATGEQATDTTPAYSVLDDVLAVVPDSEPKVWSETVLERLTELRPDVYGDWQPTQLAAALKPHGITTGQVWGQDDGGRGANRRGITRADLEKALDARDHPKALGRGRGAERAAPEPRKATDDTAS